MGAGWDARTGLDGALCVVRRVCAPPHPRFRASIEKRANPSVVERWQRGLGGGYNTTQMFTIARRAGLWMTTRAISEKPRGRPRIAVDVAHLARYLHTGQGQREQHA
jgi:hypothetical protein